MTPDGRASATYSRTICRVAGIGRRLVVAMGAGACSGLAGSYAGMRVRGQYRSWPEMMRDIGAYVSYDLDDPVALGGLGWFLVIGGWSAMLGAGYVAATTLGLRRSVAAGALYGAGAHVGDVALFRWLMRPLDSERQHPQPGVPKAFPAEVGLGVIVSWLDARLPTR